MSFNGTLVVLGPSPSQNSTVDLKTNSLTTPTGLKISHCRGQNVLGTPRVTQSPNKCYYLTCLAAPWNSPICHVHLMWFWVLSGEKVLSPGCLSRTTSHHCWILQLYEVVCISWDKWEIGQKSKQILGKWDIHRGLWKITYFLEDLEVNEHV